ncbi:hypothetical protein EPN52_01955 [bacterium]|nr:MAG: hypothetical protein EPN52_01955 [bacterium]
MLADRYELTGDFDSVQAWFEEHGLTDGLPIVPPTEERVTAMLAAIGAPGERSLGTMLPAANDATLEKLAANAVMAGCRPLHFAVVVAAVRALLEPAFNLYGVQATTHPVAPLVVVHGPIAREIGMNGGAGVFGPGYLANSAIGRAIRLILMNVGGAYPGERDRATQGSPAKYAYAITENVAESPWPEFHASRGFDANENAVTVFGGEATHNINDHESNSPTRLLEIVADVMRGLGHNTWYLTQSGRNDCAVVFSPEHAALIAADGWTRADVQRYLFQHAVRPVRDLRKGGMWGMRDWPAWMNAQADDDEATFPCVRDADSIVILVAGGAGKHSSVIPGFGASHFVTVGIEPQNA